MANRVGPSWVVKVIKHPCSSRQMSHQFYELYPLAKVYLGEKKTNSEETMQDFFNPIIG